MNETALAKRDVFVTSEAPYQVNIRRIDIADNAAMQKLGSLHMELLSKWGPMTVLGERFVREACYAVNMQDGLLQADLLEIDGKAVGFVAYTAHSVSFHRNSLRAHWLRVLMELTYALISQPKRILGLVRAIGVVGSRRAEQKDNAEALGEIVCIAIKPEYLSASFVRARGVRASEILIEHAASYMRRAGVREMRMLVDKPNKAALFLYHKLGASFAEFSQAGTPMVEVTFDLSQHLLSAQLHIPDIWENKSVQVDSGWRSYWERVADNEKIFRHEAEDYITRFKRNVSLPDNLRILDFGSGYGFIAAEFANLDHRVALWDASSNARKQARFRLAPYSNVLFLDLQNGPESTDYENQFDLITVHSVIQYMSPQEFKQWLDCWRRMLVPGGRIILSDIMTPTSPTLPELMSLLSLSIKKRFFARALWECVRETPYYWRMRSSLSLLRLSEPELAGLVRAAGFRLTELKENLSHRRARMSVSLEKFL